MVFFGGGARPVSSAAAVSHELLDYYLDEFTFRFNRRHDRAHGLLFYRLLQQAVEADPVLYARLVAPEPDHNTLGATRATWIGLFPFWILDRP